MKRLANIRSHIRRLLATSLLLTLFVISCAPDPVLPIPEVTDDGWRTASLESVGLDPVLLQEAIAKIEQGTYQNVHSIVIVKDDGSALDYGTYLGGSGNDSGVGIALDASDRIYLAGQSNSTSSPNSSNNAESNSTTCPNSSANT